MISATRSNKDGLAVNTANRGTPMGKRPRKLSKRIKASSGWAVVASPASKAGVSSVSISRARVFRVARTRPWCQPRMVEQTPSALVNPISVRVRTVSESFSLPVKTKLPCAPRAGESSNNLA